jgi:hypothetical protein
MVPSRYNPRLEPGLGDDHSRQIEGPSPEDSGRWVSRLQVRLSDHFDGGHNRRDASETNKSPPTPPGPTEALGSTVFDARYKPRILPRPMAPKPRMRKAATRPRTRAKKPPARRRPTFRFYKLKPRRPPAQLPEAPPPFAILRNLKPGNYLLSHVFPGFLDAPPFSEYPGVAQHNRELAEGTHIQIVAEEMWMYVAPYELPPFAEEVGWKPYTSRTNCIVVGHKHLADSPSITLYMDIYHEFFHILQRDAGRELWDDAHAYVDSPTELEAYGFAIAAARRLGVPDSFLRHYLEVEWVSPTDHRRLLRNLGVDGGRSS